MFIAANTGGIIKQVSALLYITLSVQSNSAGLQNVDLFMPFLHSKPERLSAQAVPDALKNTHGLIDVAVFLLLVAANVFCKVLAKQPSYRPIVKPYKRLLEFAQVKEYLLQF